MEVDILEASLKTVRTRNEEFKEKTFLLSD
jgi:hypothetical protein